MRDAFLKVLHDLASNDPDVILVTGDLGYSVFEDFEEKYPNQYINVGVAEQNMIGISSGLALEGKTIFVYSIGNFPSLRCLEQIRNDACYHELNINIIASGGGFSYGGLGMSHHATEDLSIMRALPGVIVIAPATAWETTEATKELYKAKGVGYLRIDKSKVENPIKPSKDFQIGKANILRKGNDVTLIAVGGIANEAIKASIELSNNGVECRVLSLCSVKPIDIEAIKCACEETRGIITIEESNLAGGLGSAIAEVCMDSLVYPKNFMRIGLNDQYSVKVGSQFFLRSYYKMDKVRIINSVMEIMKNSKLSESDDKEIKSFKLNALRAIKLEKLGGKEKIKTYTKEGVTIYPLSKYDIKDSHKISLLKEWRENNQDAFPTSSKITQAGTLKWLKNSVLNREDRLMFFVKDVYGETIGHVGISSFDYHNKTCEVDNIVRGKISLQSKAMKYAMQALLCWIDDNISPEYIFLRVFNHNTNAINLYHKLGFQLDSLYPLMKVENNDELKWIDSDTEVERFFVSMKIKCSEIDKR